MKKFAVTICFLIFSGVVFGGFQIGEVYQETEFDYAHQWFSMNSSNGYPCVEIKTLFTDDDDRWFLKEMDGFVEVSDRGRCKFEQTFTFSRNPSEDLGDPLEFDFRQSYGWFQIDKKVGKMAWGIPEEGYDEEDGKTLYYGFDLRLALSCWSSHTAQFKEIEINQFQYGLNQELLGIEISGRGSIMPEPATLMLLGIGACCMRRKYRV